MLDKHFEELLCRVAAHYESLERGIRGVIDEVVGPICSTCTRVCCKVSYCRRTLRNPWYRYLFEAYDDPEKISWDGGESPPGLGPNGCVITAGRYAYCYAYNCRAVLNSLKSSEARKVFQEISDILKNIGLNFMGKRHLTDVKCWQEITPERLRVFDKKIEEGTERFRKLRSLLFMNKPGI